MADAAFTSYCFDCNYEQPNWKKRRQSPTCNSLKLEIQDSSESDDYNGND